METSVDITLTTAEPLTDADFAKEWWSTDHFRLLPGEHDDHTVFAIDFYDRCKYFGYTKELVFYRAASLAAHIDSWAPNAFVMEHAARVPYTIRCISSGLNDLQARRLREHARCPSAAELTHSSRQHRPDPQLLATRTRRAASPRDPFWRTSRDENVSETPPGTVQIRLLEHPATSTARNYGKSNFTVIRARIVYTFFYGDHNGTKTTA